MLSVCVWPQGSNCSQFRGQRSHKKQFWLALLQLTAGVYRVCVCVSCVCLDRCRTAGWILFVSCRVFPHCLSRSVWRVTTVGAVNIYNSTPTQFMVLQDRGIQSVGSLLIFNWGGMTRWLGLRLTLTLILKVVVSAEDASEWSQKYYGNIIETLRRRRVSMIL